MLKSQDIKARRIAFFFKPCEERLIFRRLFLFQTRYNLRGTVCRKKVDAVEIKRAGFGVVIISPGKDIAVKG